MRSALAVFSIMAVGCSDSALKTYNADPVATITAPTDGEVVVEGETVNIRGQVGDSNHSLDELSVTWVIAGTETCTDSAPDDEGVVLCDTTFELGAGEILLEVRDPDGAGDSDNVTIIVDLADGPPDDPPDDPSNTPPTCSITAPDDGSSSIVGEEIQLEAMVDDEDSSPSLLAVIWASDKDAMLGESTPDSDGTVRFTTSELSVDTHQLTITVTDEAGDICTDSISITINPVTTPPTAAITAPEDGSTVLAGESVTFSGEVNDTEDGPTGLSVQWDVNGDVVSVEGADDSGAVTFMPEESLPNGPHAITLTVTDTDGMTAADTITITVTEAPTVTITDPEDSTTVLAGESVTFTAEVADNEDEASSLNLQWDIDGDIVSEASADPEGAANYTTEEPLPSGTHTVTLTATDSDGFSTSDSVTLNIAEAPTVNITNPEDGSIFLVGDLISFSGTVSDSEDAPAEINLQWAIGDIIVYEGTADSSGISTFAYGDLAFGDHTVRLIATDSDGFTAEDVINLTVNAPPNAPTVFITPDPAFTTDSLVAVAEGSSDPEGTGTITYRYVWFTDGIEDTTVTGDTYPAERTTKHHTYRVEVIPSDGIHDGPPGTAERTVSNADLDITSISVTPDEGPKGTAVVCEATASDPDADPITITYAWSDGSTGPDFTIPDDAETGTAFTCTATASDGDGHTATASADVTVTNTAPEITSVVLTPSDLYTNDTATAIVTTTDLDADEVTLTYEFYVEEELVQDGSSNTLDGIIHFDKDQQVSVHVTADDGEATDTAISDPVTVLNTPPTAPVVSITVESPCPEGWSIMDDGDRCVQVFESEGFTWYDSRDACEDEGGTLASMVSLADNDQVMDLAVGLAGNSIWIGYNDIASEGDWEWVGGDPETFENWRTAGGEPNGWTTENCVEMYHNDVEWPGYESYWNDAPCESEGHNGGYVCQIAAGGASGAVQWSTDEGGNGHWYAVRSNSDGITWSEAKAAAEAEGGHLVTLTSEAEDVWVYETLLTDSSVWMFGEAHARGPYMGLYETDGAFEWVTGEPSDYFNWVPGDPNGSAPNDVGSFYNYAPTPGHGWSDEDFTSIGEHYIVEWAALIDVGLICTIDEASTDDDGDPIDYTFDWDVDGTPFTDSESIAYDGDAVPSSALGPDEVWTCDVTPLDGDDDGDFGSAEHYVDATCPGTDPSCPATSCKEILDHGHSTGSGLYYIDLDGVGAHSVYCDMDTDGGGWTVVGWWGDYSGYAMRDFEGGRADADVRDALAGVYSSSHPPAGPAHYSRAAINTLFNDGESEYMSLTGTHVGGYILVRFRKDEIDADYDAFRGVYDTWYMQENGFSAVYMKDGYNGNPLPLYSVFWTPVEISARFLGDDYVDLYHYLPDDITDPHEWLFRENSDEIPASEISDSSSVPSILMVR